VRDEIVRRHDPLVGVYWIQAILAIRKGRDHDYTAVTTEWE
jgi:hypothetical protein